MSGWRIAAVVPTLDERAAIGDVTSGLLVAGACCVIAVDAGSRDGTQAAVRASGGLLVHEPRRGYGRACLTGIDVAMDPARSGHDHDAIAFLDGDGSCDPADLARLAPALDDADVVLGHRPRRLVERGAMPWHAALGNRLVAAMVRMRTGRAVRDLPPFKVVRTEAVRRLDLDDERYGWTVQLVGRALADRGLRVTERDVGFRVRRGGRSKVSGSLRASFAAAHGMLGEARRSTAERPLVALVVKAPRAGHSKTRLAAGIGVESALELWRACVRDTGASLLATTRRIGAARLAVVPGPDDAGAVSTLLGAGWTVAVQTRAGLAGGIVDGCLAAWDRGATSAIVVAGDSPTLPPVLIERALEALRHMPAVLGPTLDGGYYLIGVSWRRPPAVPALAERERERFARRLESALRHAAMGGASALQTTRDGLAGVGLAPRILAPWVDLDTAADIAPLRASLATTPTANHTRRALDALRPPEPSRERRSPEPAVGAG